MVKSRLIRNRASNVCQRSKSVSRKSVRRALTLESLEDRRVMAVDWRNPADALDVNGDGFVVPLDVLLIINYINSKQPQNLPGQRDVNKPFIDVNGDQFSSPIDALIVINHLNQGNSGERRLEEGRQLANETDVTITLGQTAGTRTYRVGLDSVFDTSTTSTAVKDLLAVYLVDPQNPSATLLDRGAAGTSLFTLSSGGKADFVPGVVAWDGSVLTIDLTNSVRGRDTGVLKFQLLSSDSVLGSRVTIRPLSNTLDETGALRPTFANPDEPLVAGGSLDLSSLTATTSVRADIQNVRFSSATGRYAADLVLFNSGPSLGSSLAVAFPGLPAGVTLRNASGTASDGSPYLNVKPAILRGGLAQGSYTLPVKIEFDDPTLVPFSIRPQVYAGTNRAPTLAPISTQNVTVGGVLRVPLIAGDLDGDSLTFDVKVADVGGSPPNGRMEANGTLVFRPAPNQVGTTNLRVSADDGVLSTSINFTLNVLDDAITSTRISGKVLQVNGQPLVGMRVDVGAVQGLTQSDGSFTLDLGSGPVVSDTIRVRGELFAGSAAYPFIAEKLPFMLGHTVYAGVNNVIDRPIYLPVLDVANGKTISPTNDTTVTSAALPDVSVLVKAGSLMNQQGTPFTGKLSITKVPTNLTPAALPENLRPDLVVTIQPGEMVFTQPAPMTFPNSGWAPGTITDLWSINPVTGEFDDVGDMRVNAAGTLIETISGGVRNSSWHFVAPPPPPFPTGGGSGSGSGGTGGRGQGNPRNEDAGCGPCDIGDNKERDFSSQIDLFSGAVIETHDLVTYQSQGVDRGLSLKYDSLRADPRPIVHVQLEGTAQRPIRPPAPEQWIVAGVEFLDSPLVVPTPLICNPLEGCTGGASLSTPMNYWNYSSTQKIDVALQLDMRAQPSGVYEYNLTSGYMTPDVSACVGLCVPGPRFIYSLTDSYSELVTVNSIDSPFGTGWGLQGQQSLVVSGEETLLLVDGGGDETVYRFDKATGSYISPVGDFSKLERVNGLFLRTTPDQTKYQFNSDHQLATVTDRNGNVTTYNYTGKRLTSIVDPVGATTTLTYIGNRVAAITDPANRQTKLEYDSQGNLIAITDPDNATRRWEYDAGHHMIAEVDALGRREEAEYGFHGRAVSARRKDGSTVQIRSPQVEALYPPERTLDPFKAPKAFVLGEVEANYADANGQVSRTRLDRRGQVLSESDSLGNLPAEQRNANNLPLVEVDGRGNATEFTYDEKGNLLTERDSLSTAGGNGLDTVDINGSISMSGEVDRYSFYGVAGQVLAIDSLQDSSPNANLFIDLSGPDDYAAVPLNSPFVLTKTGTYKLDAFLAPTGSGFTGSYGLRIVNLGSATPLQLGTNVNLPAQVNQPLYWSFDGTRGQKLTFSNSFLAGSIATFELHEQTNFLKSHIAFENSPGFSLTLPESGRYVLVMRPHLPTDYTGNSFSVALTNPAPVSKTGFDVERSGTVLAGQEQIIAASAPAGTIVYLDRDNTQLEYELKDESTGIIVNLTNSELPVLSSSGNYTLTVRNRASDAQDFRLRLIDLAATTLATIGTPVSGSVANRRSQVFRFVGQAGQRIDFGPRIDGLDARLRTLDSSLGYIQAAGIQTLQRTGEYFVTLEHQSGAIINYNFPMFDVAQATPLALNATVSSELQVDGSPIYYSFDAKREDRLFLDDLGSSPNVIVRLYGNSNFPVFGGQSLAASEGSLTISNNGTHTLVLDAPNANRPASFSFRLLTAKTTTAELTIGQTIFGSVVEPNETDIYSFSGTTGQRLYFDGLNPFLLGSTFVNLRTPTGGNLSFSGGLSPFSDSQLLVLPQTGRYEVEVKQFASQADSALGDYRFRMLDASSATSISLNTTLNSGLSNGTEARLYRFQGARGQRVHITRISGDGIVADLYSPGGVKLATAETFANPTVALAETGEYVVVIRNDITSVTDGANPKSFEFRLDDVTQTPVTPSGFGILHSGDSTQSQIDVATFAANAGTQLVVEEIQRSDAALLFLFDPDDVGVPMSAVTVLQKSGQYKLQAISRFGNTPVGQYAYRLQQIADGSLISLDTTITGNIARAGEKAVYQFNASSDGRIYLDRLIDDNSTIYRFYDPTGREISYEPFTPLTFPISGTYSLIVDRLQSTGAFSFQLRNVGAAPLVQYGEETSGTVSPSTLAVLRRFGGQAGQKIYFDGDRVGWRIVSPDNHVLGFLDGTAKDSIQLPTTGVYLVTRDNAQVDPVDFRFKITAYTEPVRALNSAPKKGFKAYTYDSKFNQITKQVDELERTTLFDVDPANGNTLRLARVVGQIGGSDDVVTSYSYTAAGLIDTTTDPLGRITDYDYDAQGRLIALVSAKGTSLQTTRAYQYDAAGNVISADDENGNRTQYAYDARNRLTRISEPDPDGSGPLSAPVTQFTYDAVGNLLTVTDAAGQVTTSSYDLLDRLVSRVDGANNLTRIEYDKAGNPIRIVDPLGRVQQLRYDARQRIVAVIDQAGNQTSLTYDADNNPLSLTDASGNRTTYSYDARGRLVKRVDPLGSVETYTYDVVDNLAKRTDRLGRTTESTYDELDRLTNEVWQASDGTIVNSIDSSYDAADNLLRIQDSYSDLQFTYDALNRVTRVQTSGPHGLPTSILDYTFDAVGNRLTVADMINGQAGGTNTYAYDAMNRATRVAQSGTGISNKRVDLAYNGLSQLTAVARFSDLAGLIPVASTAFTYDSLNRISNIAHRNTASSVLNSFAFQYDAIGRITRLTDVDGVTDYRYDSRDELVSVNHADPANADETYTYDQTGNRSSSHLHGTAYVVGDGVAGTADNNRLTSDGTYRYAYDAEGNLSLRTHIATGAVREFSWDHRNRLTRVRDRASVNGEVTQIVEYTYDALNRRIASKVDANPADANDGAITYFVYDNDNVLAEYRDADGTGLQPAAKSTRYLHGPAVDQVFAQENSLGEVSWMLTDHLGTTRDVINNAGQIVNHLKYDSFGKVISETNPQTSSRYRFTGREFDVETGLYYFRARYYDASTGRFISEDPIEFRAGDVNLFRFVGNRPTDQRDPEGTLAPIIGILVVIGEVAGEIYLYRSELDPIRFPPPPPKTTQPSGQTQGNSSQRNQTQRKLSDRQQLQRDIWSLKRELDEARLELKDCSISDFRRNQLKSIIRVNRDLIKQRAARIRKIDRDAAIIEEFYRATLR